MCDLSYTTQLNQLACALKQIKQSVRVEIRCNNIYVPDLDSEFMPS